MSGNIQSKVDTVFGRKDDKKTSNAKKKVSSLYETVTKEYNPFLTKNGEVLNPYINYQQILDNDNVNSRVKSYITKATGLKPTTKSYKESTEDSSGAFKFNGNLDGANLLNLDVATELPKLNETQISAILSEYFPNSTVIKTSDAKGIYKAQQQSGMSALAILGIGALESGYGTSQIAKQKNNLWGWNATNVNPGGNATAWSSMEEAATGWAKKYMDLYYSKRGSKSIYSTGTGKNPSGLGYAYNDDGSISSTWATSVGDIMNKFYQTAKKTATQQYSRRRYSPRNSNVGSASGGVYASKVGNKVANTSSYKNDAAYGQCVWYVRGRMKEKFGKDWGAIGNANQGWYSAPSQTRLSPTAENIKANTVASFKRGTSSAGQAYGHVIYIEAVDGDTVYYTEGGSGYHKSGTDGVIKKTTKQNILNGTGGFGSGLIGLIDITKL